MDDNLKLKEITVIEPIYGEVIEPPGLAEFRAHLDADGKSTHTINAYLSDLRHYAQWLQTAIGMPFFPSTIARYDLQAYRKHCRHEERAAPATLNRRLAALRTFAEWAIKAGHLTLDIDALFTGVRPARSVKQPPHWLEEREYHRFMRTVEIGVNTGRQIGSKAKEPTIFGRKMAVRDGACITLMALAGLRVGEVAALRVADIRISARSGEVTIQSGKGDKTRKIPLTKDARTALSQWLAYRQGANPHAEPLFLGRRKGLGFGVNGIQERVNIIAAASGVPGVTPHRLRHTFARRFVVHNRERLGDDCLMMLKDLMGHERLETTMQYAQPGRAAMAAALEYL